MNERQIKILILMIYENTRMECGTRLKWLIKNETIRKILKIVEPNEKLNMQLEILKWNGKWNMFKFNEAWQTSLNAS